MAQEQSLKELTFLSTNEEERYSRVQKNAIVEYIDKWREKQERSL